MASCGRRARITSLPPTSSTRRWLSRSPSSAAGSRRRARARPTRARRSRSRGGAAFSTGDNPAFGGLYYINYNFEAPFYGVASSNRPELLKPYLRQHFWEATFQQVRTAHAGYSGLDYARDLTPLDLFRPAPAPATVAATKNMRFLDQKSNGTFEALPAIWYYEYTLDADYLKTKLYPNL